MGPGAFEGPTSRWCWRAAYAHCWRATVRVSRAGRAPLHNLPRCGGVCACATRRRNPPMTAAAAAKSLCSTGLKLSTVPDPGGGAERRWLWSGGACTTGERPQGGGGELRRRPSWIPAGLAQPCHAPPARARNAAVYAMRAAFPGVSGQRHAVPSPRCPEAAGRRRPARSVRWALRLGPNLVARAGASRRLAPTAACGSAVSGNGAPPGAGARARRRLSDNISMCGGAIHGCLNVRLHFSVSRDLCSNCLAELRCAREEGGFCG